MSGQELFAKRNEITRELNALLGEYRTDSQNAAEAEREYRVRLAVAMNAVHAAGVAWSATGDLARGSEEVASLRCARDCMRGILDATQEAINVKKLQLRIIQADIEREWHEQR